MKTVMTRWPWTKEEEEEYGKKAGRRIEQYSNSSYKYIDVRLWRAAEEIKKRELKRFKEAQDKKWRNWLESMSR